MEITTAQFARAAGVTSGAVTKSLKRAGHYQGVRPTQPHANPIMWPVVEVCAALDLKPDTFNPAAITPPARGWYLKSDGEWAHEVFNRHEVATLCQLFEYLQRPIQFVKEQEAQYLLDVVYNVPHRIRRDPETARRYLTIILSMLSNVSRAEFEGKDDWTSIDLAQAISEVADGLSISLCAPGSENHQQLERQRRARRGAPL